MIIYLDTNIFMYLLEENGILTRKAADIITEHQQAGNLLYTSVITITEFGTGNTKDVDYFDLITGLNIVPVDSTIANNAVTLRQNNKLGLGDALHLATALYMAAEQLCTNDRPFAKIASDYLKVTRL